MNWKKFDQRNCSELKVGGLYLIHNIETKEIDLASPYKYERNVGNDLMAVREEGFGFISDIENVTHYCKVELPA